MIGIELELGNTKEIGCLVATSIYSVVDAEIGIKLVRLLHSRFHVKQAQIERSRNDGRHSSERSDLPRVINSRRPYSYSSEYRVIQILLQRTIQNVSSRTPHPSPCLLDLEQPRSRVASPRPCSLLRRPSVGSAPSPGHRFTRSLLHSRRFTMPG